jgi:hypothetical protein
VIDRRVAPAVEPNPHAEGAASLDRTPVSERELYGIEDRIRRRIVEEVRQRVARIARAEP